MHVDLDRGRILPIDQILAGYSPGAHVSQDFFDNKLAFIILLNFPVATLEEKIENGDEWTRREWAEVRLAERFDSRVPAEVNLALSQASAKADAYISGYNIWMHHLLTEDGERLFEPGLRLISHWNLRDELKANYGQPDALPKQRMIQKVMEHIVRQSIPAAVVDDPRVDWKPYSNQIRESTVVDYDESEFAPLEQQVSTEHEPFTRYEMLLETFQAARLADPYNPTNPSLIERRFNVNREIPEERVRAIFNEVMTSPLLEDVAELIEEDLGRELEPFDIWYNGFRSAGTYSEKELDQITQEKYPTAAAFEEDIPNILQKLGFSAELAEYVSQYIDVHPSRGAGHAFGAARRGDTAYLRTRVGPDGMDYKGYNIAVHELGHNVEQVLSMNKIDHTLLQGVPNTAFTEALAFVFQDRDLELLGLETPNEKSEAMKVLDDFWGTYEIAGVALVDMGVWHYMYDHPEATPQELRDATVEIARDVWNEYFAPVFGIEDVVLLGIYSHMIDSMLYIPDYPLGHLISFQIKQQMEEAGEVGPEFARMVTIGDLTPDLWMTEATGKPVGPDALLGAAEEALKIVK
ncbi:MAG: hypothetical protein R3338_05340, partial [Thermoanaerobaculia bacterium]|nr:hypothetical protein [Thermoanaerobaculia bacterium]